MNNSINIIIVDNDLKWVKKFTNYIKGLKDIKITEHIDNYQETLQLSDQINTDIILINIDEADSWDGLNKIIELTHAYDAKVILINSGEEKKFILDVIKEEKLDSIDKGKVEEIPELIRKVYENNSTGFFYLMDKLRKEFMRLKKIELLQKEGLTLKEIEVVEYIDKGYTRNEIADQAFMSINTLKKHISSINEKLGATNGKEAVQILKDRGLI